MRFEKLCLLDMIESADAIQHIAVHRYFAVLWQIVWNTAIHDVPDLRLKIKQILTEEFPGE